MISTLNVVFNLLLIILVMLIILAFFVIKFYNTLVQARNGWKNAFAQIDVQLQRRFDLIPNLVETAKAYMAHERQTMEAVVSARNTAQAGLSAARQNPGDAKSMLQLASSSNMLEGVLGRLMAVMEAYPDLKASENMMQLNEELSSTENRVSFARQAYNDAIMDYNNKCETFPSNLIASTFNFKQASLLEIPAEQQQQVKTAPKVRF